MSSSRDEARPAGGALSSLAAVRLTGSSMLLLLLLLSVGDAMAQPQQSAATAGLGRPATARELAAWNIDVRPDWKGLPRGAGTVAAGMVVWEAKCASCHGVFGESNEFFAPIVGGTTEADMRTGRVASLADNSFPSRTTLMKLSHLSTLWDYIRRAMPWNAPKSLSVDEVYAVTAYILHLGGVVPESFTLSDRTIAAVQQRLPNRHGKTTAHALWPGAPLGAASASSRRVDVVATACMVGCAPEPAVVASRLPDFARTAHGNLAEQNRLVGAQRGLDTGPPAAAPVAQAAAESGALALARKHTCTACHGLDSRIVGPSFDEIAAKYAGRADAPGYLAGKVKAGGVGIWGTMAMPAQALSEADAQAIGAWLAAGASR